MPLVSENFGYCGKCVSVNTRQIDIQIMKKTHKRLMMIIWIIIIIIIIQREGEREHENASEFELD